MRLHERSIVFDGVDLCEEYGLHYSSFEETLPARKLVIVKIPYGTDIDISDRLGDGGWENGQHVLKFLLYGGTEDERLQAKDKLQNLVNGEYADYSLTWDKYTYRGRASVSIEHRSELVDVVTVTIDRNPWRVASVTETIDLAYGAQSNSTRTVKYSFDSTRYRSYRNVKITALTAVDGNWYSASEYSRCEHYGLNGATDEEVADEVTGGRDYWLRLVNGWLLWFDEENSNMVVRSSKYNISGSDIVIDENKTLTDWTVTNGDLAFDYYPKQTVTLEYEGWNI